jgi:putative membrane protein
MMGFGYGGWMMALGGLFWLLIFAVVVAVIVRATHTAWPPNRQLRSTGLDILEERYARGEIQRDEYLQKKQDLLDPGP